MAQRRTFLLNATLITAGLAFVGGVITSVTTLFGATQNAAEAVESERCRMVYDALLDDRLNQSLSDEQARRFLVEQLNLARKCAERIK